MQFPERYLGQGWTTTFVFDAGSGTTYALVEGLEVSVEDKVRSDKRSDAIPCILEELRDLLEATKRLAKHPFHLLLVLLDLFIRENVAETNNIHARFGEAEEATGSTDWFSSDAASDWEAKSAENRAKEKTEWKEEVQNLTMRWTEVPRLQNRIPFHERRWSFICHFIHFLIEEHGSYRQFCHNAKNPLDDDVCDEVNEILQNQKRFAADHLNEVQCLYPFVWEIGSHFSKPIKFGAYLPEKFFIGSKTMAANLPDEGIEEHKA